MQWNNRTRTLTIGERQGNYPGMIGKRTFCIITPDGQKQTAEYAGQTVTCKL